MAPVSPEFEKEVVQAVKLLQKRKGVTIRGLVKHLVTFYGYERHKVFTSSVRRVLKRFVRRGAALREGLRYKFHKDRGICQCRSKKCSKKVGKKGPEARKLEAPEGSSMSSED